MLRRKSSAGWHGSHDLERLNQGTNIDVKFAQQTGIKETGVGCREKSIPGRRNPCEGQKRRGPLAGGEGAMGRKAGFQQAGEAGRGQAGTLVSTLRLCLMVSHWGLLWKEVTRSDLCF